MRIDGTNPWSALEGLASQKTETSSAISPNQDSLTSSAGDEARVSPEGALASHLYQQLSTVPEIRQSKVEHLRDAIHRGTYNVSAEQIATAMQNDLRGLAPAR